MLTLHYKGQDIPTGNDFSVRMEWMNPVCFMDKIPGNAGLGIEIPGNDYSRTIFGNPHRFAKYSTAQDRKFPDCEIRFGGVLLMSGTLNISNATKESYSGWLQSELGVLGEEQQDKAITDLDWKQGEVLVKMQYYDGQTDEYYPYPLYNSAFWNGKGKEVAVTKSYTDDDGEVHKVGVMVHYLTMVFRRDFYRIVNAKSGGTVKTEGEACVVSPYLYLRYALRELLKLNKFYIDRNDMINDVGDL